ncbi:MAG: hypothetical protein A2Y12_15375 [Planctomycetes bacterium GWF2_42_9]|nr:MAG: hypothetical protein A2Y12_15375 [Planctomycetes bacterium GWF2_42_9]
MELTTGIVLATEQKDFAEKVKGLITWNWSTAQTDVCSVAAELRDRLASTKASVVIVDIDFDTNKKLIELDRLVPLYPDKRFAVASSVSNEELVIDAMRAGARYFLHKNVIETELDKFLEKIIGDGQEAFSHHGEIIAVLSAGGGCGATTIALNLINELRLKYSQPVLAIDLDEDYGAMAAYLGIKSNYGVSYILSQNERIDHQLISTTAAAYKENFDVLLSPASVMNAESINGNSSNLAQVFKACRAAYKYTIVDAPRVPEKIFQAVINVSSFNIVVLQPNVKDVKIAEQMIAKLRHYGIRSEKIILLINRYQFGGSVVPIDEIKKIINLNEIYKVRNDFKRVIRGINCGKLLSDVSPRSPARRDMIKIAEIVTA